MDEPLEHQVQRQSAGRTRDTLRNLSPVDGGEEDLRQKRHTSEQRPPQSKKKRNKNKERKVQQPPQEADKTPPDFQVIVERVSIDAPLHPLPLSFLFSKSRLGRFHATSYCSPLLLFLKAPCFDFLHSHLPFSRLFRIQTIP